MKAEWVKCWAPGCEETTCTSWEHRYQRHLCAKHRRQEEIDRVMDKHWETLHSRKDCDAK